MKIPHRTLGSPDETNVQRMARRKEGVRKPLRSMKEMALEFGVSVPTLSAFMRHDPNAPKSLYRTGGKHRPKNTWVDPDALRIWWKMRTNKNT